MAQSKQEGWDTKYCYPESNVLINRMNIKDASELHEFERKISVYQMALLKKEPISGEFDLKHLQKIHKFLFHEIYGWAGRIRSVDIAKGNLFCKVEFIPEASNEIFSKLAKENFCIGLPEDRFFSRLAYYMGEINAIHPFREGNGRTQRQFIRELGITAGYEINFGGISKDRMIEASIESFQCNYQPLERLVRDSAEKVSYEAQFKAAMNIVLPNSKPAQAVRNYKEYIQQIQESISAAGYLPTDKLVRDVERIDQKFGKKHSIKEIRQYGKNIEKLPRDEKLLVQDVTDDFKAQERKLKKENIPHPEP